MSKSHVSLDVHICPVCAQEHDVGVLLQQHLRPVLERKTVTGWSMCPEHKKLKDDGYIALVAVDEQASTNMTPDGVWRLGQIAHLRESVWSQVFNVPVPPKGLCFVPPEVIDMLQKLPTE